MFRSVLFGNIRSLFLLSLAVIAITMTTMTTAIGNSASNQAWADVIEGTEGPDVIVGTPEDDLIDSKGGEDINIGDTFSGDGSGDDIIISGEEDDTNTGNGGRDIFVCGDGEDDTVTDYNEAEGDIATPDCENT
jgi:Ca2+-binding RTX toxin-like protein